MNRRQFLSFASVPIAAAVVVPELVRTIILPPRGGWPTITFKEPDLVLFHLLSDLQRYWREAYDVGFLDEIGNRVKFVEHWPAIYGKSGV